MKGRGSESARPVRLEGELDGADRPRRARLPIDTEALTDAGGIADGRSHRGPGGRSVPQAGSRVIVRSCGPGGTQAGTRVIAYPA